MSGWARTVVLAALLQAGCSRPGMGDESARIDEVTRPEAASPAAPGIVLGADAPALAPPFYPRRPYRWRPSGPGWGGPPAQWQRGYPRYDDR